MDLGQRLRQARLEAGLSQKALCGDTITRNMLSLIENGTARPSMETLCVLAQRLGKSVGWLLGEDVVSGGDVMEAARAAYLRQDYAEAAKLAAQADPAFRQEAQLLGLQSTLTLAEQALAQRRQPYARQLLEQARGLSGGCIYADEALRRLALLEAELTGDLSLLPDDDRALLLRAKDALDREAAERAGLLLDAARDHSSGRWNLLRGQVHMALSQMEQAAQCLRLAEEEDPKRCAALLEQCCLALEDYKGAYHYACKLRQLERQT